MKEKNYKSATNGEMRKESGSPGIQKQPQKHSNKQIYILPDLVFSRHRHPWREIRPWKNLDKDNKKQTEGYFQIFIILISSWHLEPTARLKSGRSRSRLDGKKIERFIKTQPCTPCSSRPPTSLDLTAWKFFSLVVIFWYLLLSCCLCPCGQVRHTWRPFNSPDLAMDLAFRSWQWR